MQLYTTTSTAEKQRLVEANEKRLREMQEQQAQQQMQMQQQQLAMNAQMEQAKLQHEYQMNRENNETKILVANINSVAEQQRMEIINHEDGLTKEQELELKKQEMAQKSEEFMDKAQYFTVMAFDVKDSKILNYMGTKSGRDGDKAKALGLHTAYTANGTPYYTEATMVMVSEVKGTPLRFCSNASSNASCIRCARLTSQRVTTAMTAMHAVTMAIIRMFLRFIFIFLLFYAAKVIYSLHKTKENSVIFRLAVSDVFHR